MSKGQPPPRDSVKDRSRSWFAEQNDGPALHRVLARASLVIGVGLAFGGLYGFGKELDGGVFGAVWFVSGLAFFIWIVAASITLLRRPVV